jgi:hypothetical protein
MAKTAIVSGAHPAPSRGDDPPYPPMSVIPGISAARTNVTGDASA